MSMPRIFLGSSGKQAKLLQAITRGLEDIVDVEPWTTTFNPGRSTLDRLVELSREVDFAAFVFAQDDWITTETSQSGQASPRDNVVFEAGGFGGGPCIRRPLFPPPQRLTVAAAPPRPHPPRPHPPAP